MMALGYGDDAGVVCEVAVRQWSDAEVEAAFERARPVVRHIAWSILRDPEEVADAVQEVFARVWSARQNITATSAAQLSAFIRSTATRCCMNLREHLQRVVLASRQGEREGEPLDPDDLPASAEVPREAEVREEFDVLLDAFATLSKAHRDTLMVNLRSRSYRAAAERMQVREVCFRARLHKARRELRNSLRHDY